MKLYDILDERNILPIRSELINAKNKHGYQSEILQDIFKKIAPKINVLGTGSFGLAIKLPNIPYVCKLWVNDPGYRDFVKFCQDHKSVHLPKFLDASQLRTVRKTVNESYYSTIKFNNKIFEFAIVEQLKRISYPEFDGTGPWLKYRAWMCKISMLDKFDIGEVIDDLANARGSEDVMEKYSIITRDQLIEHWDEIEESLGGIPESWKLVTVDLVEYIKQNPTLKFDLHNENFMSRGDTFVITDPFYFKGDSKLEF